MNIWRHKLGLIVPSWNTVMEYETQRMAGGGISVHTQRIAHTADTEENLMWMGTQVPEAARLLAHAKVNVICYGCTAGGFLKGPQYDRDMNAGIRALTGIPGTTSASAITDALNAMGAQRIAVATAYEPWLNERTRQYLEAAGFSVLAIEGFGTQAHAAVTPERVAALAKQVNRAEAQAIFIGCSNLRTLDVIEALEQELGKPVITSNQASMWSMLRLTGNRDAVAGAGLLFREA
ncbi:MAG: maleate cis-trans isomerase family protein [Burkholderiales bacterium]